MKRAASKTAGGARKKANSTSGVTPKCRTIASAIRSAEGVPAPVKSMLCDTLTRSFGTYKEERHALQKTVSDLVGKILKESESKLQAAINGAKQNKAAVEAEAGPAVQANDQATAALEAAAKALADSKQAVADSKAAVRDAKVGLHGLKDALHTTDADHKAAVARKAAFETLIADYITPIKQGELGGVAAGKHVASVVKSTVEPEFLSCVAETFAKKGNTWGTFDNIVDKKLSEVVTGTVASVTAEIEKLAAAKEAKAAEIESQKVVITTAEEKVKGTEEATTAASAAVKEAETAAKAASVGLKPFASGINKATEAVTNAEDALAAFTKGPLAAYAEVEARTAPPPPPEPEQAGGLEQAMQAAPAVQAAPSMLPSPRIAVGRAMEAVGSLMGSPRVAPSPQI